LDQNKMLENLVILNVRGRTTSTSKHHLLCQVHSLIREHYLLVLLQQQSNTSKFSQTLGM
jgi:hypothetical protein